MICVWTTGLNLSVHVGPVLAKSIPNQSLIKLWLINSPDFTHLHLACCKSQ